MNSIRALAMQHIGHRVVVHSQMGIHHGILHHVDDNGMYLQLMNNQYQTSSFDGHEVGARVLGHPEGVDASLVWAPFFFIPWAAAYAFSPWGWWW